MPTTDRGAELSACGLYRYRLWRTWDDGPTGLFVMLNPSTADGTEDDPTIRRCLGFAHREGWGGLEVVNLFAFRSPHPDRLREAPDPRGPENLWAIRDAITRAAVVVAAWSSWLDTPGHRRRLGWPENGPVNLAAHAQKPLVCLGTTKHGHPRHPLYVRADAPLVAWEDPRRCAGQT